MTSGGSGLGDIFFAISMTGLFGYICWRYWQKQKRMRRVERFLLANGLEKSSLPQSFSTDLLPGSITNGSVQHCYAGKYRGHTAVVGEVRVPSGNDDYYDQTFVAVERPTSERYEVPPLIRTLEVHFVQKERWVIGTIDRHAMDVDAVEGYLACFT